MTRQSRSWRIRLAFEPNRFSHEQLERIYEQLKPAEAHATGRVPSHDQPVTIKRHSIKRGNP